MAKRGGKSEDEERRVLRCDRLPTFMNRGKERKLRRMLVNWRRAAAEVAHDQWKIFHRTRRFDGFHDPATDYRKELASARSGILNLIVDRFGVVQETPPEAEETEVTDGAETPGKKKKKRKTLPKDAPGLVDPTARIKALVGAAQYQMVRPQVVGILESYVSNRQNDFVSAVMRSSVTDEVTRHMLFAVNRARAWFTFDLPVSVVRDGETLVVPRHLRLLARKIMSHIMKRNRKPRMKGIGMVVDQRGAVLGGSATATSFDLWLRLTVARGERIDVPMRSNDYFAARKGERKQTFQINEDRDTGRITVGVVTDVSEAFAESREAYRETVRREELSLDFGLATMFATDGGDLFGRNFLKKLKSLDDVLTKMGRKLQKAGHKPRSSSRYRRMTIRVRGFVTSEINRVLNRLVAVHRPSKLVLERLDFRDAGFSRRMRRILRNCGRAAVKAKLRSLDEQLGIEAEEISPAYTSLTCSGCGYVDRKNRPTQERFHCRWCGNSMHADVNAARNIGSERFRSVGSSPYVGRRTILDALVSRHVERWPVPEPGHERGKASSSNPRLTNPYFKAALDDAAELAVKSQKGSATETQVKELSL